MRAMVKIMALELPDGTRFPWVRDYGDVHYYEGGATIEQLQSIRQSLNVLVVDQAFSPKDGRYLLCVTLCRDSVFLSQSECISQRQRRAADAREIRKCVEGCPF